MIVSPIRVGDNPWSGFLGFLRLDRCRYEDADHQSDSEVTDTPCGHLDVVVGDAENDVCCHGNHATGYNWQQQPAKIFF